MEEDVHSRRRFGPSTSQPHASSSSTATVGHTPTPTTRRRRKDRAAVEPTEEVVLYERALLSGLTLAGIATSVLMTVHHQMHPLQTDHLRPHASAHPYDPHDASTSIRNKNYIFLKTLFCVVGGCLIDVSFGWNDTTTSSHSAVPQDPLGILLQQASPLTDMVGVTGCLLVLGTFFPVAFHCWLPVTLMLLAAPVAARFPLTDAGRISYAASGMTCNLLALLLVRVVVWQTEERPLYMDDSSKTMFESLLSGHLTTFCMLALTIGCFMKAQRIIHRGGGAKGRHKSSGGVWTVGRIVRQSMLRMRRRKGDEDSKKGDCLDDAVPPQQYTIQWRASVQRLARSRNFQAWIGMAVLLEAQSAFFLTCVAVLIAENESSAPIASSMEWVLPLILPIRQLFAIALAYGPIRMFGYCRVLRMHCYTVTCLGIFVLTVGYSQSIVTNIVILLSYPITTKAMRAIMFPLVVADLSMELQYQDAVAGRLHKPPTVGLIMGITALCSKPVAALCSMIAQRVMDSFGDNVGSQRTFSSLAIIPVVCSFLQILLWRRYDLNPSRTAQLRADMCHLFKAAQTPRSADV